MPSCVKGKGKSGKPKGKIEISLKRHASKAKAAVKHCPTKMEEMGVKVIFSSKVRLFRTILDDIRNSMEDDFIIGKNSAPFKIDSMGINVLVLWFQDQLSRVLAKANKVAMIRSRLYDPVENEVVQKKQRGDAKRLSGHTLMKRDLASIVSICGERHPFVGFYTDDNIPKGMNWSGRRPTPGQPSKSPTPGQPSKSPTPGQPSESMTPGQPSKSPKPGQRSESTTPSRRSESMTPAQRSESMTPWWGGEPVTPWQGGEPSTPWRYEYE